MIELAPREYYKDLNFDDANLYCFSLNIDGKVGWRLPTKMEMFEVHRTHGLLTGIYPIWYTTSPWIIHDSENTTVPVRTVEKSFMNKIRYMFHPRYLYV
jgi:hypothetical protein